VIKILVHLNFSYILSITEITKLFKLKQVNTIFLIKPTVNRKGNPYA
jgi:hypothetical protein